jgi:hypothetical protein
MNPHPKPGKDRIKGSKNKKSAQVRAAAPVYTNESLATQRQLKLPNRSQRWEHV